MRALILRSRPVFFASALAAVLAGSTASAQTTFTNASTIVIPTVGPAMPYPSTIAVSGLTGTISKVTVQLNGFAHGFPDDVYLPSDRRRLRRGGHVPGPGPRIAVALRGAHRRVDAGLGLQRHRPQRHV